MICLSLIATIDSRLGGASLYAAAGEPKAVPLVFVAVHLRFGYLDACHCAADQK